METITLSRSNADSVADAREQAVNAVAGQIDSPVVLSWHDNESNRFAPDMPGGDPMTRWRDYGRSLGGTHEVDVAQRFRFIFGDATGFTEPRARLVNMTDSNGREYLCLEATCREETKRPLDEVYAAGGGKGGVG